MAKVRLYQAYTQDVTHTVTGIDAARLNEVVDLTTRSSLRASTVSNLILQRISCMDYDNGPESIFAIQFSINDGTAIGRLGMATSLNYSLAPQYGCCWFHIPSENMVNAFATDPSGGS